jgi:hypothetical protein
MMMEFLRQKKLRTIETEMHECCHELAILQSGRTVTRWNNEQRDDVRIFAMKTEIEAMQSRYDETFNESFANALTALHSLMVGIQSREYDADALVQHMEADRRYRDGEDSGEETGNDGQYSADETGDDDQ